VILKKVPEETGGPLRYVDDDPAMRFNLQYKPAFQSLRTDFHTAYDPLTTIALYNPYDIETHQVAKNIEMNYISTATLLQYRTTRAIPD
jgi:hypothetical protein